MGVDLKMACRMAKASDITYYVDRPGGMASCPFCGDMGFVAQPQSFLAHINAALVGTTATEVIVAFRGTLPINLDDWDDFVNSVLDWVNNGDAKLTSASYTSGLVHQGFAKSLDLLWDGVLAAVEAQHAASKLPVVVTGHSKGGALASLGALRLQHEAAITPVGVYTFGSARAGNTQFANDYDGRILKDWRFENTDDLVPHLPPAAHLLPFLAAIDSRFARLSAQAYDSVGRLEFLNWGGTLSEPKGIEEILLEGDRLVHFGKLAATGQIQQVAKDHSLVDAYIPAIARLARP
ncbi:MAG TPA: lipase family protein [Pirellulales bacterium]|nr:lipase family protein [Pirellulales bacterium]